jgi:hypothetical protein
MAETETKKLEAGGGSLYRAEFGETSAGSPFVKIRPTNPKGTYASEHQVAACIYEIAAELERKSDEVRARWAIVPATHESKITVELSEAGQPWVAKTMIEQVLAELSIPVANPQ